MINKLILGTAQFGLNYGINNNNGQLEKDQVLELLNVAYQEGIRFLDTAEIYGNAHNIIGDFHKRNENLRFKIITKFPHNFNIDVINDKVFEYINVLNITVIDVLMFHSFNSFKSNYQSVELLEELKRSGHINHIGVSVYTNNQLESLLNEDLISVVQLPFNLLDNINVRGDLLESN
jgi:aryl-alcohol dehydrogenase-like predicted oxidoreductase